MKLFITLGYDYDYDVMYAFRRLLLSNSRTIQTTSSCARSKTTQFPPRSSRMSDDSDCEGDIADHHGLEKLRIDELRIDEQGAKGVDQRQEEAEPAEWIEKYDETYNLYYYLNSITGECQWDSPFATGECEGVQQEDEDLVENDSYSENLHLQEYPEESYYEDEKAHTPTYVQHHQHGHDQQRQQFEDQQRQQFEYEEQQRSYADAWNEHHASQPVYYTQEEQDYPFEHTQDEPDFPFDYESDEAGDHFESNDYEPYDEETAPKAVKDRSKDRLPQGTSQDYVHMARMYKLTRPYSDPDYTALCVLCHTNFADMVFFPCEHRCVCSECIHNESICSDKEMETTPHGYCNCSLCAGIIKLILPSEGGAEIEKYWNWVYEEPIPLSSNFLRNFRHSAGVIRAVHVRNGDGKDVDSFENASKSCVIS